MISISDFRHRGAPAQMGKTFASVDETVISYDIFLGDILFKAGGCDFSATWGWIPLIDFAFSLRQIVDELSAGAGAVSIFEFTESDATLRFERDADTAIITASYAPGLARVPFMDFAETVEGFSRRMIEAIAQQYPALLRNRLLGRYLPVPPMERP